MNKQDLIIAVVGKTGLDKKTVTLAVESTFEEIANALANGEKVSLHGFGAFEVRERAARQGVNPKLLKELKDQGIDAEAARLQAAIQIEASKAPAFKAAKSLKDAVK
jgi:DNA-binding protein HU-beta